MLGLGDNVLEQVLITECPRASSGLGEQSSTPHCHCSLAEGLSAELGRGPERGAGQRASARSWAEGLSAELGRGPQHGAQLGQRPHHGDYGVVSNIAEGPKGAE